MAEPRQHTLTIHGRRTFLNRSGEGKREAVLFVHGSGPGATGWSNWQFALPFFGDHFDCLAPDLIGFGQSEHPSAPPARIGEWLDLWLRQIIGLLDDLRIPRAHLAGNSMGGAVALHLLDRHPGRFDRAVLLGPLGTPHAITPALDLLWGFYDDPTAERMAQIIRGFVYDPSFIKGDLNEIARARLDAAMTGDVRRSFMAMFPAPRQRHIDELALPDDRIRRIQHPSLLVHGRDDVYVPLETSLYLLERLSNVEAHVIGQCSHWIMIERRDTFHRVVRAFLTGNPARALNP